MSTPATGYSLEAVHTVRASYGIEPDPEASLDAEREIGFLWDWHVNSPTQFAVVLGAKIGPSDTDRDELEAIVVGTFEILGEMQSVDLKGFVALNGPAVLMPYLRQALTALSGQGPFGAFYLPPVNIKALSDDFDTEAATGTVQLKDNPSLIGSASE